MRIFTNPGANLPAAALSRYGIVLAPQQIVVDGVSHDTRTPISLAQVDAWVHSAKELPYVVGTTAKEFADLFIEALKSERELLAVMVSRRIIKSCDAAESAARTLLGRASQAGATISVLDTTSTDLGTGLLCIAAGEAALAGLELTPTLRLLNAMVRDSASIYYLDDLERAVRGGRAGVVRAWLADKLKRRPLLSLIDGEAATVGTVQATEDPAPLLVAEIERRIGPGKRVWVGIMHGGLPEAAVRCLGLCRERFDVELSVIGSFGPGVYLHVGAGSLGLAAIALDKLPHRLRAPAPFA